jgi:hypothetical protein
MGVGVRRRPSMGAHIVMHSTMRHTTAVQLITKCYALSALCLVGTMEMNMSRTASRRGR